MTSPRSHGDGAGEHLRMARGSYSAWPHVVLGFLMVTTLMAAIPFFAGVLVLEPPGRPPYFADRHERDLAGMIVIAASGGFGLVMAWLIFRDRWKCVEAFTSRFCSGVTNISLVYAPLIAAGYALARGFRKLTDNEQAEMQQANPPAEAALHRNALVDVLARAAEQANRGTETRGYVGSPALAQPGSHVVLARVILLAVVAAAVALFLTRHTWMASLSAESGTDGPCPNGERYCRLPVALSLGADLGAAGLSLRLKPGEVDVTPKEMALEVSGTITLEERSELEVLRLGARLQDATGKELAVVPIKVRESFMPPLRSGDSGAFYERARVTDVPRRGEIVVLERHAVPAGAAGDDGAPMPLVLPASAPGQFKLSALVRHRESKQLGIKMSGKTVVVVRNDGEGVVRDLKINLVPRGGAGADLGPTYPQTVVYGHMPPMYPGERRVVSLDYYVTGPVLEERLVVTAVE